MIFMKNINNPNLDIYFERPYGEIYEKMENGSYEEFLFECDFGVIKHSFIKRLIPQTKFDFNLFDLVTPYGYGGPLILETSNEKELVQCFYQEFREYCKKNHIVSEFVRFHPILQNNMSFGNIYFVEFSRKTLATDLQYEDPVQENFSKSCRKNIKKALNNGVTFEVLEKPTDLNSFMEIYYSTMDRNSANDYYYFDKEYFDKILQNFRENLLVVKAYYEDTVIAQGLYFLYNNLIHIHLSGTLKEYLHLSPAYVLRYALTVWGKNNGYSLIHHGGGRTNSSEDGLFKFKKSFAQKKEFDFYTGKKIWNEQYYEILCTEKGVALNINSDFFPKYRDNM